MRSILVGTCCFVLASLLISSVDIPVSHAVTNIDGVWTSVDGGTPPSGRREYAAVYDRMHQRYVMFAGFTNEPGNGYYLFNEVWTLSLDGTTPSWSYVSIPGSVPGERHSPQWGYDPARNRLIMFGGYGRHYPGDPYAYLNDVWELKLNGAANWHELTPAGTPPQGRLAGTAVFDVLNQRFVGFGGTAGLPIDTWQLDMKGQPTWSTVPTNGIEPPGSYGLTSIFDSVRNRMIVFGGSTSASYFGAQNTAWELDLKPALPVWRQLNPGGTLPAARRSLTSIYDPRRDRMVIFGGAIAEESGNTFFNDTWALSLSSGDGAWTQLSPTGSVPGVRDIMSAAYDPKSDRMVLFGGWSGTNILGDTQFLTWSDAGDDAIATASAGVDNGVAQLGWDTENTAGKLGAVYRRESNTDWTSIGTFEADALGHVDFQDQAITPGHSYGYQIIMPSPSGDALVGEVWLAAPTGVGDTPNAALSLRVWPNPASGPFAISFSPVSKETARVEMFNVSGQRVLTRNVKASGSATRIDIGDARDFASGVYYMRLTQSGRSTTSRFVLVR